jgi:hypothetical protein
MFRIKTTLVSKYSPCQLAKKYEITCAQLNVKLAKGMRVESEHTRNSQVAKKIALDHLAEDLNYYDKLLKIERKFKK